MARKGTAGTPWSTRASTRDSEGTPQLARRRHRRADAERLAAWLTSELEGVNDEVRSLSFGAYLTSRWLPAKRLVLAATTYNG